MLYAGVSWDSAGYEVVFRPLRGRGARPPARFAADERDGIVAYLRRLARAPEQSLVAVVESTNGVLDGSLMAAGLEVYRADPWMLARRPVLASVPARALADTARRDLTQLTRLGISGGTLTGRLDELQAGIARSVAAEQPLKRAGRWFGNGSREHTGIALTFDDGPHPPYTGGVLDVLDRYGVPATFFCVGLHAGAHSEEIARMTEAGHLIGNHTWSHAFLPDLTRSQLEEQIERTNEAIDGAGGTPTRYFRPPYGARSPEVVGWLGDHGVTTVLWDVDAADWTMPEPAKIAADVLERTRPGSVIVLHDGGGDRSNTVAALPALIEGLLERGHRFVPADELAPPVTRPLAETVEEPA
ncbi:polysaccharide deacetylase family protein [Nonomuraea sp. NPDC059023]|uniref:polysaccharide deacetylase family protein n=1 Tax=Nonomuraea sp. NPDC059023 TaxID=3346706 RepID=UPI00367C29F3